MSTSLSLPFGRSWLITGLHWEAFDADRDDRKRLVQLAETLESSKFVVLSGWFAQAGFAKLEKREQSRRHVSLAAAITEVANRLAFPPTWLGIFQIDSAKGLWWMVAVNDTAILAGSDVAGRLEEVREVFQSFLTRKSDWDAYVMPPAMANEPEWLAPEWRDRVRPVEFNEWLPAGASRESWLRRFRLEDVDAPRIRRQRLMMALTTIAILAGMGWWGWSTYQENLRTRAAEAAAAAAEAARRAAAEVAKQTSTAQQSVLPGVVAIASLPAPQPWLKVAPVQPFLIGCTRAFAALPPTQANWSLTEARCDGQEVSASYLRGNTGAPVMQFVSKVPHAVVGPDGKTAEVRMTLMPPAIDPAKRDLEKAQFLSMTDALLRLNDRFQVLGVEVPLREAPLPPNTYRAAKDVPEKLAPNITPLIQDWRTISFFVGTALPPTLLSSALDLPGLRVRFIRMTVAPATGSTSYMIDGEMYAQ